MFQPLGHRRQRPLSAVCRLDGGIVGEGRARQQRGDSGGGEKPGGIHHVGGPPLNCRSLIYVVRGGCGRGPDASRLRIRAGAGGATLAGIGALTWFDQASFLAATPGASLDTAARFAWYVKNLQGMAGGMPPLYVVIFGTGS